MQKAAWTAAKGCKANHKLGGTLVVVLLGSV